jgi:hypothetical protein
VQKQQRLKKLAETAVLQDSITKQNYLIEMRDIVSDITLDQLKEVIRDIDSPVALKFLVSAGVYGEAHTLTFAKLQKLLSKPVS